MRSGIGILAAIGIAGLALAAAADDGYISRSRSLYEPAPRRSAEYFSKDAGTAETAPPTENPSENPFENPFATRYTRRTESAPAETPRTATTSGLPGVRNYHKELFGTERPSAKAPAAAQTAQTPRYSAPSYGEPETAGLPATARGVGGAPPRHELPGGRLTTDPRPEVRDPRADLLHADYRSRFGETPRGQIEPVRGTDENVSPFAQAEERGAAQDVASQEPAEDANPFAAARARMRAAPARETAPARTTAAARETRPTPSVTTSTARPTQQPLRTAAAPRRETNPRQEPAPARPPVQQTRFTTPSNAADYSTMTAAFGTTNAQQTPTVTVHWVKRSEINVGQPCDCDLVVRNTSKVDAKEVVVEAYFPKSVRLTSVKPAPSHSSDFLSWNFAELAAGEEQTIRISMIPSVRGELATNALVRFTGTASGLFTVEEPLLALEAKGPREVLLGDPASQIIVVSNPGTGVANNVTIEAEIPPGLEHPRGERLMMEIGSLNPGEARQVRLALGTTEGGTHKLHVIARADTSLEEHLHSDVSVIAPSVKLAIDGPSLRYIGRNATYTLNVTNDGSGASNNVRVTHKIPESFKFLRADKGGSYEDSSRTASWFVGRLEPGQSTQLKIELEPVEPGSAFHIADATTEQGARSEARVETQVEGTASLVLEIVDLDDPVEVGLETAYEVRVKNSGTAAAENVGVACELEHGVELVDAKGPSDHIVERGLVVFKSLRSLEPGKTALYRVHVRGKMDGNHRFRARLVSDSIREPLIFEELTKFYGEGE